MISGPMHGPGDSAAHPDESPIVERAIAAALAAMERAYAPYSGFPVGAALVCADDKIVVGTNVENASYPAGVCAERVAVGSAVAAGHRDFAAIVVATGSDRPSPPCGICRQVLAEFAPGIRVVSVTTSGARRVWNLDDLLPSPFSASFVDPSE